MTVFDRKKTVPIRSSIVWRIAWRTSDIHTVSRLKDETALQSITVDAVRKYQASQMVTSECCWSSCRQHRARAAALWCSGRSLSYLAATLTWSPPRAGKARSRSVVA